MPHDPKLHAKTRSKTKDGRWMAFRGRAAQEKEARKAFLAAGGAAAVPPVDDKPAPTGSPEPMPEVITPDIPAPAAPPPAPAPFAPAPTGEAPSMQETISALTDAISDARLTMDALSDFYVSCGVQDAANPSVEIENSGTIRLTIVEKLKAL